MRGNREVAAALEELADLTELTGGDRFRILAYRRAADTVRGLAREVASLGPAELTGLRGIGKATAGKVRQLLETGTIDKLEQLRRQVPAGIRAMTRLPGLGPKKAILLHGALGISTLEELRAAVEAQRLREVPGFGPKTEENLLQALDEFTGRDERIPLARALRLAESLVAGLSESPAVARSSYAGSLRRMRETIGDVDLLAAGADPPALMDAFASLPKVLRVLARGPTKSSVLTTEGFQVDLRVVAPDEYGAALQYFTGSKAHNVKVREHAVRQGFKLSEYGLFRVRASGGGPAERVAAETEEDVYGALGMQTPPPPMREDRGEVELALRGELPRLVELADVRGDLQTHSTYSDGRATLEEMVEAAARRGYEYYAVTDHGRRLALRSLSLEDIDRQAGEVRRLNERLAGRITLLHGVELNVGPEGELDYPDEVLARFDVVVASVHHQMKMDRAAMTRRIVRAIDHPRVHVIGHPTGRRMGRREAYELDLEAVCRAAAKSGVALEINGSPERLDLKDDHIHLAREHGCLLAISTDAHSVRELDNMRLGVATAQRGWVTPEMVVNCRPLRELRRFLEKR